MAVWYIKKLDNATGPHILRIQQRNFPSRAGGAASTMRPIVTIRECIHKSCDQKQCPHHSAADTEHLGIEYHQKRAGKNKGKIVAKVTEHVADLIPPAKSLTSPSFIALTLHLLLPSERMKRVCPDYLSCIPFFWRYMRSSASASSSWLFCFPCSPRIAQPILIDSCHGVSAPQAIAFTFSCV